MPRKRRVRWPPEMAAEIERLIEAGWRDTEIGTQLGRSTASIRYYRQRKGINSPAGVGRPAKPTAKQSFDVLADLVAVLDADRRTARAIARHAGVAASRVTLLRLGRGAVSVPSLVYLAGALGYDVKLVRQDTSEIYQRRAGAEAPQVAEPVDP